MHRRPVSLLLALCWAVSLPAPVHAGAPAPEDVDARAAALFDAGKYLEAAAVWTDALGAVPEQPRSRGQRNAWAIGAVNAYSSEFERAPGRCPVILDAIALADQYIGGLVVEYGKQATVDNDYVGMSERRGELDRARAAAGCPEQPDRAGSVPEPEETRPSGATGDGDTAAAATGSGDRAGRGGSSRGLAVGVGVSAALTVGMTIAGALTFVSLRKPGGDAYHAIYTSARDNMVPHGKDDDMCVAGKGITAVDSACADWAAHRRTYLATTVLAGVFAVTTAALTGLLIKQRRQSARGLAFVRRHRVQLGAAPQRGGAAVVAGLRF